MLQINIGKLKLRYQLALLIGIALFMMIVVQIFYYIKFYSMTQSKGNIYSTDIMNQVEEKLVSAAQDIKNAAQTIGYNLQAQEFLITDDIVVRSELSNAVLNAMIYVKSSNKNIKNIILTDTKGRIVGPTSSNDFWIMKQLTEKYKLDTNGMKEPFFTSSIRNEIGEGLSFSYVLPIFVTLGNSELYRNVIGTSIVICDTAFFEKIVQSFSITENSKLLIIDRNNTIVACNNKSMQGTVFNMLAFNEKNEDSRRLIEKYNGIKSVIQYKEVSNLGWKIVSIVPINEMTSDLRSIRSFGFAIGLATTLILLVIGIVFIRSITNPIEKMIMLMKNIGEKNIKQRLELSEYNEVGILAGDINKMLDKIEEMTKKVFVTQSSLYEMELAKKQAELSALQSQINPHFLYNTLDCMRGIGVVNNVKEIVSIASAMADIFRYSIKDDKYVSIKDEIDCINNYLSIMSIRYTGKFTTNIEVEDSIKDMKTLKMIFQPIIENAVYHGLERKKGKGRLSLRGRLIDKSMIRFEITDDGKGMTEAELESFEQYLNANTENSSIGRDAKRSIGLANIQKRIKLFCGDRYGIKLFSKENEGTTVIIELPVAIE